MNIKRKRETQILSVINIIVKMAICYMLITLITLFLVSLTLGPGCLPQGRQQVGVHLAGVATGAGQLGHQAGLVRRPGVAVEVLDGGGEEGDSLLQLVGQRVLQEFSEAEDDACNEISG